MDYFALIFSLCPLFLIRHGELIMTQALIPVILAGGKPNHDSSFNSCHPCWWPKENVLALSRRHRPKQFLCLDSSGQSLLQSTADRLLP